MHQQTIRRHLSAINAPYWEAPLNAAIDERQAIVEPVCNTQPDDSDCTLSAKQLASMFGFRELCLIGWHRRTVDPIAHASNDPADEELGYAVRRSQQDGPDDHDGSPGNDHDLPSEQFAVKEAEEASGRTSNVVNRCHDPLHVRVRLVELLSECIRVDADEPTHHALV